MHPSADVHIVIPLPIVIHGFVYGKTSVFKFLVYLVNYMHRPLTLCHISLKPYMLWGPMLCCQICVNWPVLYLSHVSSIYTYFQTVWKFQSERTLIFFSSRFHHSTSVSSFQKLGKNIRLGKTISRPDHSNVHNSLPA